MVAGALLQNRLKSSLDSASDKKFASDLICRTSTLLLNLMFPSTMILINLMQCGQDDAELFTTCTTASLSQKIVTRPFNNNQSLPHFSNAAVNANNSKNSMLRSKSCMKSTGHCANIHLFPNTAPIPNSGFFEA